jgi:hypothetical protein
MNKFALMALLGVTIFSSVAQADNRLTAESVLSAGQYLQSTNGRYTLVMQTDGNLVVYAVTSTSARPIWSTGQGGSYVRMQMDGNLAVYRSNNTWHWTSGTGGRPYNMGFYLQLNDDGSLKIVDPTGAVIWRTNSDPMLPPSCPEGSPVRQYATCTYLNTMALDGWVLARCQAEAQYMAASTGSVLGSCQR